MDESPWGLYLFDKGFFIPNRDFIVGEWHERIRKERTRLDCDGKELQMLFESLDVWHWRKEEQIPIPKLENSYRQLDGSGYTLIWQNGNRFKEVNYEFSDYHEKAAFPELEKFRQLEGWVIKHDHLR